jgi:uncharacterized protein YhaN
MSRGRMSGQQWRDKMEHSAFPKSKTMSNETIEAAEKFMAEHIPDRLDFALDPHTRSEAQKLMADFSDQQNAELKAEVEKLREQLEAAKVALEKVDGECPYGDCSCKLLHTVARKALARIEEDK